MLREYRSRWEEKSPCMSAVAEYLGVKHEIKFLQVEEDIVKATRKQWNVKKYQYKGSTIEEAKEIISSIPIQKRLVGYIIIVSNHVLFLNKYGKIKIDTDPIENGIDNRKIENMYSVSFK